MAVKEQEITKQYAIYNGDCVRGGTVLCCIIKPLWGKSKDTSKHQNMLRGKLTQRSGALCLPARPVRDSFGGSLSTLPKVITVFARGSAISKGRSGNLNRWANAVLWLVHPIRTGKVESPQSTRNFEEVRRMRNGDPRCSLGTTGLVRNAADAAASALICELRTAPPGCPASRHCSGLPRLRARAR